MKFIFCSIHQVNTLNNKEATMADNKKRKMNEEPAHGELIVIGAEGKTGEIPKQMVIRAEGLFYKHEEEASFKKKASPDVPRMATAQSATVQDLSECGVPDVEENVWLSLSTKWIWSTGGEGLSMLKSSQASSVLG